MYTRRLVFAIGGVVLLSLMACEWVVAQSSSSEQQQNMNNELNFLPSKQARPFSIPGDNPLPNSLQTPPHLAPPTTDGNFGHLVPLLNFKDTFTTGDADAFIRNSGKMRVLTSCYIPETLRRPSRSLRILTELQDRDAFKSQYQLIGIGNYKALDTNCISEHVLGMAIKEGLRIGADIILFQEGAALVQVAKGYSVGLFGSMSFVNSGTGNGFGNVSVGGVGFGRGETGYVSKPWLRVHFFREIVPRSIEPESNMSLLQEQHPREGVAAYKEAIKPTLAVAADDAYHGPPSAFVQDPNR